MNPACDTVFGRRYQRLPDTCYRRVRPTPLPDPYWLAVNRPLARELGLSLEPDPAHPDLALFSGNALPPGCQPLATRYAGHQFGVYVPQLGDGRALLLGDLPWQGGRAEIQLKGAGPTPFSRMGDGRAVLRSSIREYLASEAMHALGIPTTRALCLIGSDQMVLREMPETAAVLTRVAPGFVRFGTFEALAHRGETGALRALADFVIEHHFPQAADAADPVAALYAAVCNLTARLIAQWQAVGFCHGVMNTDNMSILGLTLDYGPFGFLDGFDAGHVCNHSDHAGRYAFHQQPRVAQWNLQCLGSALLPLTGEEALLPGLASFRPAFERAFLARMRQKLGLQREVDGDGEQLIEPLLLLLHAERIDYTRFFRALSHGADDRIGSWFGERSRWSGWLARYRARLEEEDRSEAARLAAMRAVNPAYVLRNYLAENAIALARDRRDPGGIERLARCLAHPFDETPAFDDYAAAPPDWARDICLSCSS